MLQRGNGKKAIRERKRMAIKESFWGGKKRIDNLGLERGKIIGVVKENEKENFQGQGWPVRIVVTRWANNFGVVSMVIFFSRGS